MFNHFRQDVVISETDIEQALKHLKTLSGRATLPESWDRQRLLNRLRDAIGHSASVDAIHAIAPGLFAIIKPFGTDLALTAEPEHGLQVWLLIRPCGTDPTRIISIRE